MSCFLPKGKMPCPKRMRVSREAAECAEEGEDECEEDEAMAEREVLRSASRGGGDEQVGGLAALATDLEDGVHKNADEQPSHEMELEEEEPAMSHFDEEALEEPLPLEDEQEGEEAEKEAEQATGFNPSLELPNVNFDSNDGNEASSSQSAPSGTHDPAAWNPRTRKMYAVLQNAFGKSDGESLSYDAMIKRTRKSADKRKVVAGCFQELLFLTTHGMIELDQKKAYGNILVSKTELFGTGPKAVAA